MGNGMRGTASFLAVVILSSAAAFGQAPGTAPAASVTLMNMEDSWFYFVLDPKELQGLTATSPLLKSRVSSYFLTESEDFPFTGIAPGASYYFTGLSDGSHLLMGFFAKRDETEYPVRVLTVQVDKKIGTRFYSIFSDPELIAVKRDAERLAKFNGPPGEQAVAAKTQESAPPSPAKPEPGAEGPAAVETTSAAELEPQELASYSASFAPAVFTREEGGDFSVKPIAQSKYWERDGTRVKAIYGVREDGAISIEIASDRGFSKEVSYFFYLFGDREMGKENSFTIEIKPVLEEREKGIALLWEKGKELPMEIGTVKVEDGKCRFSADMGSFPPEAVGALGENVSADFTACYFDEKSGVYEEFFYTTLTLQEIPGTTH
jgi:hypothetical protein